MEFLKPLQIQELPNIEPKLLKPLEQEKFYLKKPIQPNLKLLLNKASVAIYKNDNEEINKLLLMIKNLLFNTNDKQIININPKIIKAINEASAIISKYFIDKNDKNLNDANEEINKLKIAFQDKRGGKLETSEYLKDKFNLRKKLIIGEINAGNNNKSLIKELKEINKFQKNI